MARIIIDIAIIILSIRGITTTEGLWQIISWFALAFAATSLVIEVWHRTRGAKH